MLTTDQLYAVAKRYNLRGVNIPVAFREIEKMVMAQQVKVEQWPVLTDPQEIRECFEEDDNE